MVVFLTSRSIEVDIGACLESRFPSFLHTSDATALYIYRIFHFIAYPYLVQRGHNMLEKKEYGNLQAVLYVGKQMRLLTWRLDGFSCTHNLFCV